MEKNKKKLPEEALSELLSAYKFNNTYIRVLESKEDQRIAVQVTDNPAKWLSNEDEDYFRYRILRRLEIGCDKLSISCINHQQLLLIQGPLLGIRIPVKQTKIIEADMNNGIHIFETSLEYRDKILKGLRRLLKMSPQLKADIIEESVNRFMKG